MTFYQLNLAAFACGNAFLLYRQYRRDKAAGPEELKDDAETQGMLARTATTEEVRRFKLDFFLVYGMAVAADWLQVGLQGVLLPTCRTFD